MSHKISVNQVAEIKRIFIQIQELKAKLKTYGLSPAMLSNIKLGKFYGYVDPETPEVIYTPEQINVDEALEKAHNRGWGIGN